MKWLVQQQAVWSQPGLNESGERGASENQEKNHVFTDHNNGKEVCFRASVPYDWTEMNHTWLTKAATVSDTFNTNTAHFYFLSWAPTAGMNNALLIWWCALSCWTPLGIFWLSLASSSFYPEVSACKTAVYLHSNMRQIVIPHRRPSRTLGFASSRWWIF